MNFTLAEKLARAYLQLVLGLFYYLSQSDTFQNSYQLTNL